MEEKTSGNKSNINKSTGKIKTNSSAKSLNNKKDRNKIKVNEQKKQEQLESINNKSTKRKTIGKRTVFNLTILASSILFACSVIALSIILTYKREVNILVPSEYAEFVIGEGTYKEKDNITLQAEDRIGYSFEGWEYNGSIVETSKKYSFEASTETAGTYTPIYKAIDYIITQSDILSPSNSGLVVGSYSVSQNTANYLDEISIENINLNLGYNVSNVYYTIEGSSEKISIPYVNNKYSLKMPAKNIKIGFELNKTNFIKNLNTELGNVEIVSINGQAPESNTNLDVVHNLIAGDVVILKATETNGTFYGWSFDENGQLSSDTNSEYTWTISNDQEPCLYAHFQNTTINVNINGVNYLLDTRNNEATIANNQNSKVINVVIPESVNYFDSSFNVTHIQDSAFMGNTNLKSITFHENIVCGHWNFIWNSVFENCVNLETVVLPKIVYNGEGSGSAKWGDNIFKNCINLKYLNYDSTTKLNVLPSGIPAMGAFVFDNCKSLLDINLKNVEMNNACFRNCSSLVRVLNSSATTWQSFYNCTNLIEIDFSTNKSGYNIIGTSAFANCINLTNITIENSNAYYLLEIYSSAFRGCTSIADLNFLSTSSFNSIKIGDHAFYGCTGLNSINLNNENIIIGTYAFEECSNLQTVTFNSNSDISFETREEVWPGHSGAFKNCYSLTNVTLPNSVTEIPGALFFSCRSLANINIPSSVTTIGEYALMACNSLKQLYIPISVTSIHESAFGNPTYGYTQLDNVILTNSSQINLISSVYGLKYAKQIEIVNSVDAISDYLNSNYVYVGEFEITVNEILMYVKRYVK